VVISLEQTLALMGAGEVRRHIGRTDMNDASSRSHTIFRMVIESRECTKDKGKHKINGDPTQRRSNSLDGAVKVSMLVRLSLQCSTSFQG
jgi:hypothetical protein